MPAASKTPLMDNSEGLAYGAMMLILYFAAAALIMLAWGMVIDMILVVHINPTIAAGEVSRQTVNATSFNVNAIKYSPVIIILFGFIYGVNRGIFKRSTGG